MYSYFDCIFLFFLIISSLLNRSFLTLKVFINTILISVFAICCACNLFTGNGITDSVIFTLQTLTSADLLWFDFIKPIVFIFILLVILMVIIIFNLKFIKLRTLITQNTSLTNSLYAFLAITYICVSFSLDNFYKISSNLLTISLDNKPIINSPVHQYYVNDIDKIKLKKKYNFVYIYAESLEKSFRNLKNENYLPNIEKLANQSIEFTNITQEFVGTGWSMAGMVNTQCGIPLELAGNGGNKLNSFLSNAMCIGDILTKNHYRIIFMQGADSKFAGADIFFKTHNSEIISLLDFKKNNIANDNNTSGWGLHDDVLFDQAWEKFNLLSHDRKQPFLLEIFTVNTHFPEGTYLKSCDGNIDKKFDNVKGTLKSVLCSDYLISKFIKKIMESEYFENTIVIVTSDHLMMGKANADLINQGLPKNTARTNNFLIIKKDENPRIINKKGSLLDVWATILDFIGVDNSGIGFGYSLFKKESSPIYKNYLTNGNINDFLQYARKLWGFENISVNKLRVVNGKVLLNNSKLEPNFIGSIKNNIIHNIVLDPYDFPTNNFIFGLDLMKKDPAQKSFFIHSINAKIFLDIFGEKYSRFELTNKAPSLIFEKDNIFLNLKKQELIFEVTPFGLGYNGIYKLDSNQNIANILNAQQSKRGVNILSLTSNNELIKIINIDTYAGQLLNISAIQKMLDNPKTDRLVFLSYDSVVGYENNKVNDEKNSQVLAKFFGDHMLNLQFRQPFLGIITKRNNQISSFLQLGNSEQQILIKR